MVLSVLGHSIPGIRTLALLRAIVVSAIMGGHIAKADVTYPFRIGVESERQLSLPSDRWLAQCVFIGYPSDIKNIQISAFDSWQVKEKHFTKLQIKALPWPQHQRACLALVQSRIVKRIGRWIGNDRLPNSKIACPTFAAVDYFQRGRIPIWRVRRGWIYARINGHKDISTQFSRSSLLGASYEIAGGVVNKISGQGEEAGDKHQEDRTKGGYQLIASLYKSDKTFPIVLGFLCLGPIIGLLFVVAGYFWGGCGVLMGWLLLFLYLLSGAWQ
jgi:hypothetical protein